MLATTELVQGELVSPGHPYYRNLPETHEGLMCPCGSPATVLVMVPGQRLDRCHTCYHGIAPYLDRRCRLVFIGPAHC